MPDRDESRTTPRDPREARIQQLLGLPPSPDDIVSGVATAFAGDLRRILGKPERDAAHGRRPGAGSPRGTRAPRAPRKAGTT